MCPFISEKLGKTFDQLDISVERTLQELARVARAGQSDRRGAAWRS